MKQFIDHIATQLLPCYPEDEARSLAWWIAEELTGLSRTELQFGCKDTAFSPIMQERAAEIVSRLLHFEPIQYIFGHTVWNGLDLKLTSATLIPRPETAELVARINIQMTNDKWQMTNAQMVNVFDLGTGSGCIAIALKKAHPEWNVTGIDISPEAIEVAKENARRNNVDVRFLIADIFSDEFEINAQMTNVFVSNPPYICESEKSAMRPNVLHFEPATALFVPDSDPLRYYRRIAQFHPCYLFFEINEAYASPIETMLREMGYTDIQITRDIYGKDRIIDCRMA